MRVADDSNSVFSKEMTKETWPDHLPIEAILCVFFIELLSVGVYVRPVSFTRVPSISSVKNNIK